MTTRIGSSVVLMFALGLAACGDDADETPGSTSGDMNGTTSGDPQETDGGTETDGGPGADTGTDSGGPEEGTTGEGEDSDSSGGDSDSSGTGEGEGTGTGTGEGGTTGGVEAMTLTELFPIVFARCVDCHDGGGAGGLAFDDAESAYDEWINQDSGNPAGAAIPYVVPGDADGSYVFRKVSGMGDIDGALMPAGNPVTYPDLTPDEVELVRNWIEGGAPE